MLPNYANVIAESVKSLYFSHATLQAAVQDFLSCPQIFFFPLFLSFFSLLSNSTWTDGSLKQKQNKKKS